MRTKATKGKIIRIVELKNLQRKDSHHLYIIEAENGKQYEVIDYTHTQIYEMGDIILADNYHYVKDVFQKAKIVKIVKESE